MATLPFLVWGYHCKMKTNNGNFKKIPPLCCFGIVSYSFSPNFSCLSFPFLCACIISRAIEACAVNLPLCRTLKAEVLGISASRRSLSKLWEENRIWSVVFYFRGVAGNLKENFKRWNSTWKDGCYFSPRFCVLRSYQLLVRKWDRF